MIKVLIVDDEFRVCQLICNLIDWESLDMQIIGVAHNGIEARELARETVPDLVITDIRMPGCTGLELVEQLREIYRSVSFIIISGYTNFEYTRLAIQYGVVIIYSNPSIRKNYWQPSPGSGMKLKRADVSRQQRTGCVVHSLTIS